MRIKHWLVAIALVAASAAYAQSPKSTIQSLIGSLFPDNTTGQITPATTRTFLNNLLNSYQQYAGLNKQVGTSYTIVPSDYGQLVTFANTSTVNVLLSPASVSGFTTFNFYAENISSGNVVIAPTAGNICGASVLTLANNQSAWIVSDGTNWQCLFSLGGVQFENPLAVNHGGTGASTLTSSGLLLGQGTRAVSAVALAATDNSILQSNAAGSPSWTNTPTIVGGTINNASIGLTTASNIIATGLTTTGTAQLNGSNILSGANMVQQFRSTFGPPTVPSATCAGGNGTVTGSNMSGQLTLGASSTPGGCLVAFSVTLSNVPQACVLFPATFNSVNTTISNRVVSLSNVSWTLTGNNLASTSYYYHCF